MLKLIGFLVVYFFAGSVVGCSPIYNVSYDYDETLNPARLSAYGWLPSPKEANISSLDEGRIIEGVNADLTAKGLMSTSDNPDFLIIADVVTKDRRRFTEWGYPFYYPYRPYRGLPTLDSYQYQEGTFILDFVEPSSRKLIWRGTAKAELDYADTPDKRDKLIKTVIQKILENFPPRQ